MYLELFPKYAIVFSKEKLSQIVHQLSLEVGLFTYNEPFPKFELMKIL